MKNLTFWGLLSTIVIVAFIPFKIYLGWFPISAEVILIPALMLIAFWECRRGHLTLTHFPVQYLLIASAIFLIVSIVSLINAQSLLAGAMEILRYLSYVALFFIAVKIKLSGKQFNFLYKFTISVILAFGTFGLLQYLFELSLNTAGIYALSQAKGRVYSTFINPNYYSAVLNFFMPIILLLAVAYYKNVKFQLMLFGIYGILVLNMVLTYTRAAWMIMGGGLVLIVLLCWRKFIKGFFTRHILAATLILVLAVFLMPDVQTRVASAGYATNTLLSLFTSETATGNNAASDNNNNQKPPNEQNDNQVERVLEEDPLTGRAVFSRTKLWRTGFVMFQENPILGVGIGNYSLRYKEYVTNYPELYLGHEQYSVHNSYLKVMAETGIIGIFAFLMIYLVYFLYLLYFLRNTRPDSLVQYLLFGLLIGSITFMVQNNTNNLIFIPQTNVVFWLTSGLIMNFAYAEQMEHSL